MRALIVSAWEPWRVYDGASLVLHHQLPGLARAHEVRVIAVEGTPPADEPERALRSAYRPPAGTTLQTIPVAPSGPLTAVRRRFDGLRRREPAHVLWVERPSLVESVRREITEFRPDVVHLHGWGTAQLHRLTGTVPSVHVPVDPWALGTSQRAVSLFHRIADAGQQQLVRRHEVEHYPHHRAVVVVSQTDADYIRAAVPRSRVVVVRNGVDAGDEPSPAAWEEHPPPVVAFHGVFGARANAQAARVLVGEVLPRVRATVPAVRALLIGRDPTGELRDLHSSDVEVTGAVAEVRPHLQRAAVYVAPLVSGTGIKNKVLEAMAAGLPVVGTRLALEGVDTAAGSFERERPEEIAAAVVELLGEPGATARAGRAARARIVSEFSWDRNVSEISALWTEITST